MNEAEMFRDDDRYEAERRDDELEHIYPHRRYVTFRDPLDHAPASEVGLAPLDENFAGRFGVGGRETTPAATSPNDQSPAAPAPGPSSSHTPGRGTAGRSEAA